MSARAGYRPPAECTCGHPLAAHASSRTRGVLHPITYGVCLVPHCDCHRYAAKQ